MRNRKINQKGSIPLLIAASVSVLMLAQAGGTFLAASGDNRSKVGVLNSQEGYYATELALLHAVARDREALTPPAAISGSNPPRFHIPQLNTPERLGRRLASTDALTYTNSVVAGSGSICSQAEFGKKQTNLCVARRAPAAPPDPVTVDLKVNGSDGPVNLATVGNVTLSWTSTGATSCTVTPGNYTGTSSASTVHNVATSTIFQINCTGPGGSGTDSASVLLPSPQQVACGVARPCPPNALCGYYFLDTNNNGQREPVENKVSGGLIRLTGTDSSGNPVSRRTRADLVDGRYFFEGLPTGTYTLEGVDTVIFLPTLGMKHPPSLPGTATANQITGITYTAGTSVDGYDFGSRGLKAIFISLSCFLASTIHPCGTPRLMDAVTMTIPNTQVDSCAPMFVFDEGWTGTLRIRQTHVSPPSPLYDFGGSFRDAANNAINSFIGYPLDITSVNNGQIRIFRTTATHPFTNIEFTYTP